MKGLKVAIIVLALLTFSASASAISLPFQFGSLMGFPVNSSLESMNLFSSGLNGDNAVTSTPVTDLSSLSSAFPANSEMSGLQNDFLSNMLSTRLLSFPIINQYNNQNVATQTPSTTYQETTPTPMPTVAPTPTPAPTLVPTLVPTSTPAPTTSSQTLPAAGPNTYTDSDNGKTVTINNGDTLEVRLGQGDQGAWNFNTTDGLQIVGDTFYPEPVPNYPPDIVNDGYGTRVVDIKATKPGVQKISASLVCIGGSSYFDLTVNVV
jgi:predicted secreted protein